MPLRQLNLYELDWCWLDQEPIFVFLMYPLDLGSPWAMVLFG